MPETGVLLSKYLTEESVWNLCHKAVHLFPSRRLISKGFCLHSTQVHLPMLQMCIVVENDLFRK